MKKIIKYDSNKTYMWPSGSIATPESVLDQFPAVSTFTHFIETDESEEVLWAVQNLAAMRTLYEIDSSLSEDKALEAISDIVNAPTPEPEVSAEERIAAALEFSNLLNF